MDDVDFWNEVGITHVANDLDAALAALERAE